jgi:hypothetical protein
MPRSIHRLTHLMAAAAGALLLLAGGALLDGPSDLDMQRAIEADLVDARAQAAQSAPERRRAEAELLAEQRARRAAGQQLAAQ